MTSLGLIVAGDFALATGADRHIAFAASQLARNAQALAFAWLVPADRVQIAAAFVEAWQRPQRVACFGGLGTGVDDHVRVAVQALQAGREQVGLPRHAESIDGDVICCGNLSFFPGTPAAAHPLFERWWTELSATASGADASETLRWSLPESAANAAARRDLKADYPLIAQRVTGHSAGGVALTLTGPSKGKVQQARKALQYKLSRG